MKDKHPDIPWKAMMGMRDKVTHEYFGVKPNVLWETIQQDLPKIMVMMPPILEGLKEDDS